MHLQSPYRMTRRQWRQLVIAANPNGMDRAIARLGKLAQVLLPDGTAKLVAKRPTSKTNKRWRFERGRLVGR
jgi:hypothetical protein